MTTRDSTTTDHHRLQRMQERYDDLIREGQHGHYETMFRVWQEEFEMEMPDSTTTEVPPGWVRPEIYLDMWHKAMAYRRQLIDNGIKPDLEKYRRDAASTLSEVTNDAR